MDRVKAYLRWLKVQARKWGRSGKERLNRFRPRWLGGAGFFDFLEFFYQTTTDRKFALSAMGMAFRFFFAVFPGLILIFTLVPYIPIDNLQADVNEFLASVVPADSFGFVQEIVQEFFNKPAASVIYLNIALLMYASLSGVRSMLYALSKDTALFRRRNVFRVYGVSFIILIVLLVLFLFVIGLIAGGEFLASYLERAEMMDNARSHWLFDAFDGLVLSLIHI